MHLCDMLFSNRGSGQCAVQILQAVCVAACDANLEAGCKRSIDLRCTVY